VPIHHNPGVWVVIIFASWIKYYSKQKLTVLLFRLFWWEILITSGNPSKVSFLLVISLISIFMVVIWSWKLLKMSQFVAVNVILSIIRKTLKTKNPLISVGLGCELYGLIFKPSIRIFRKFSWKNAVKKPLNFCRGFWYDCEPDRLFFKPSTGISRKFGRKNAVKKPLNFFTGFWKNNVGDIDLKLNQILVFMMVLC
jgi:hypothetical protein